MKLFCRFLDASGQESVTVVRLCEDNTMEDLVRAWASKYDKTGTAGVLSNFQVSVLGPTGRPLKPCRPISEFEDGSDVVLVATPAAPARPESSSTPASVVESVSLCKPVETPTESQITAARPILTPLLNQALQYAEKGLWRSAFDIWTQCLAIDPSCQVALVNSGLYYLANSRFEAATQRLSNACDCLPSCVRPRVLRSIALFHLRRFEDALLGFDDCLSALGTASRQEHSKETGLAWAGSDPESGEAFPLIFTRTDLMAWAARCLYSLGDLQNAVNVVNRIVQENDTHVQGVLLYSQVCVDLGKPEGAIQALLRLIVVASKHKAVRRALSNAIGVSGGVELLQSQLPFTVESAPALAFLAVILKDHSQLDASIALFRKACALQPKNHGYALNCIHALECDLRMQEAFDFVRQHLANCPLDRVGDVSNSDIAAVLDKEVALSASLQRAGFAYRVESAEVASSAATESCGDTEVPWTVEWLPSDPPYCRVINPSATDEPLPTATPKSYDESSLDLLAIWFTAVKILHAVGALTALPRLIQLIERVRRGSTLHLTTIRNENAYYCCIAQILGFHVNGIPALELSSRGLGLLPGVSPNPSLRLPSCDSHKPLYVCGDSHSLSPSWHAITVSGAQRVLLPALVTGLKAWHLRASSDFYPKHNFEKAVATIPDGAEVVMIFCEIDCREGILLAVSRGKYEDLGEGIAEVVQLYVSQLTRLITERRMTIFVHPVVPVLNETREIVKAFNKQLEAAVLVANKTHPQLKWLDMFHVLLTPDGTLLNPSFELDGTHLSPKYLPLLADAITKAPVARTDSRAAKMEKARMSVLSYRVLAQSKAVQTRYPYRTTGVLNWTHRSHNILKEIQSYDATILCLQDVDGFDDWWQPQLAALGYDSVFAKCDNGRLEGVAIFYKREELNIFRSHVIHLNETATAISDPRGKMRAKTGDIALVLMLSPFEQSLIPTAVCAVSVMLPDDPDLSDVRDWQVRQLFRGIELFNADFCLPVVIGGSVASTPSSPLYHLITQGFPKVEPQPPEAPAPPTVEVLSMASVRVSWIPPNPGDSPIRKYRVDRMTGCPLPWLPCFHSTKLSREGVSEVVLTGLSSGVKYRFRITAISSIGHATSRPSVWVKTPESLASAVKMNELKALGQSSKNEDQEKGDDVVKAIIAAPASELKFRSTGLTPRFENGRVNHVAVSMPLSPPAGKPKSITAARAASSKMLTVSVAEHEVKSPGSGTPTDDSSYAFFGAQPSRTLSVPSSLEIDSPSAWAALKPGTKPTVITRITGRYGVDGDLDGDDELQEYELAAVEVDVDENDLRKYNCALMCRTRHSGRIHRLCLQSSHAHYRDLAARAKLLEPFDVSKWTSSLVCKPSLALSSPAGSVHSSLRHMSALMSPSGVGDAASSLFEGSVRGGREGSACSDEDDDGVASEDDKPIIDTDEPESVMQLSSMDSAVKGDDMPVVKLTHHVEFGTPKAVDPDALAQLSAAPDWFTSLGAGEPPYTACTPKLHGCVDYIWFTPGSLIMSGLMSLPSRSHVESHLPTMELSSDHVAIMAEFRFEPSCLATDW